MAQHLFSSGSNNVGDKFGHGTHVAGTIAGDSWFDSVDQGKYMGVAPQANLVNVKIADDTGLAYESDIINGIQWVIANRATYNIRVMNISLQESVAESYRTDPLDAAVEQAWFSGILVVAAAGNYGAKSELYAPANNPFVVTLAAADMVGTTSNADDAVVS